MGAVGVAFVIEPTFIVAAKDGSVDNEPRTSLCSSSSVPPAQRSNETGRSSESFDPSQLRKASRQFITQNPVRQLPLVDSTPNRFTDCGTFYQMNRQAHRVIQSFFSATSEDSGKTRDRLATSAGTVRKSHLAGESLPESFLFLFI